MKILKLYFVFVLALPALVDCKKSKNDIKTHFYVRHIQPIVIGDITEQSPAMTDMRQIFNSDKNTKIVIHGWRCHINKTSISQLLKAYRDTTDYNIIGIDWKPMAYQIYTTSITYLDDVGQYVAELIDFLIEELHTSHNRIHIVGHSLGAHIAGIAGSRIRNSKIARITGLDPASPRIKPVHCLDKNDAQFVDVIHTAAGFIGLIDQIGHADFYPNKGKADQPGCILPNCSHRRAVGFFTESILNTNRSFLSYKCDSWKSYKQGLCNNTQPIQMGENTDVTASGKYYLRTRSSSPYSMAAIV